MEQFKAVEMITNHILKDGLVDAIFLKGSLARNDYDHYSDVDFYCMVSEENLEPFLAKRIQYMETYQSLIYYSHENFVGPQIVGVFENGMHFDLYTITKNQLKQTDEIKVIYDPQEHLKDYQNIFLTMSEAEIGHMIDEFSFSLLEFETAYMRTDLIFASRLASFLCSCTLLMYRYHFDPKHAQLGSKRLYKSLPTDEYQRIDNMLNQIIPNRLPQGVINVCDVMIHITDQLSDTIPYNKRFFDFMIQKINKLPINSM